MITVLIADDHVLFRQGIEAILSAAPDCEVVGEAADGEAAVTNAIALAPTVVLMDIQMPNVNGIEATRRILQAQPEIGIIVLTMYEDDASIFAAMRAGARGYILKGADKIEVLKTIRAVAAGDALFGAAIARRITRFFAQSPVQTAQPFPELTEREREILTLIAQGKSNVEITHRLVITAKTLSNHISSIFNKLQVVDRAQAIIKARESGLGETRS